MLVSFSIGKKVNFVYHQGFPSARVAMAKRFHELNGFEYYYKNYLQNPDIPWNADYIYAFMKTLAEVSFLMLSERSI
jgi:hypothetical protein